MMKYFICQKDRLLCKGSFFMAFKHSLFTAALNKNKPRFVFCVYVIDDTSQIASLTLTFNKHIEYANHYARLL